MKTYENLNTEEKELYNKIISFFNSSNVNLKTFLRVLGVILNTLKNTKKYKNDEKNN
jgi:hypothetical protein